MKTQKSPDNTPFIIMGFIILSAIICRPQASIYIDFSKNPSVSIHESPKGSVQR